MKPLRLALVAVLVTVAATAPAYGAGTGQVYTGPGSSVPSGGGFTTNGSLYCGENDPAWGPGYGAISNTAFYTNFARCQAEFQVRWLTDDRTVCPNGWDVWNFWGDDTKAVRGMIFTRINFDRYSRMFCGSNHPGGRIPGYIYFALPDQAGTHLFATGQYRDGTGADATAYPGRDGSTDRWFRTGSLYTQTTPIGGIRGESCATMVPSSWPTDTDLQSAELRTALTNAARQLMAYGLSEATALATLGLKGTLASFTGDGLACSSGLDLLPPPGSNRTFHYGACYLPTTNYARIETGYFLGEEADVMSTLNRPGVRYDDRDADPGDTGGVVDNWRAAIFYEVASRLDDPERADYVAYLPSFFDGGVPLGELDARALPKDLNYTAREAARLAHCELSSAAAPTETTTSTTAETPQGITIELTAPQYGQVGGQTRRATIVAAADTLTLQCTTGPCDPATTSLLGLTFTLAVTPIGGYRECAAGQLLGCDYKIVARDIPAGPVQQRQSVTIEFYNATSATQGLRFEVLDPRAAYKTVEQTDVNRTTKLLLDGQWSTITIPSSATTTTTGLLDVDVTRPFNLAVIAAVQNPSTGTPKLPTGGIDLTRGGYLHYEGRALSVDTTGSTSGDYTWPTVPIGTAVPGTAPVGDTTVFRTPSTECALVASIAGSVSLLEAMIAQTSDPATRDRLQRQLDYANADLAAARAAAEASGGC